MNPSVASVPTCTSRPPDALRPASAAASTRVAVGVVVLLLALLQALGPFLHAHSRAARGGEGLHLHLVGAAPVPAAATPSWAGQVVAQPAAEPDEGSAVFLTTEYRRDIELAPVLLAFAAVVPRQPAAPADPGEGRDALRWPAASAQAPPEFPAHRLPPATAPPRA